MQIELLVRSQFVPGGVAAAQPGDGLLVNDAVGPRYRSGERRRRSASSTSRTRSCGYSPSGAEGDERPAGQPRPDLAGALADGAAQQVLGGQPGDRAERVAERVRLVGGLTDNLRDERRHQIGRIDQIVRHGGGDGGVGQQRQGQRMPTAEPGEACR